VPVHLKYVADIGAFYVETDNIKVITTWGQDQGLTRLIGDSMTVRTESSKNVKYIWISLDT